MARFGSLAGPHRQVTVPRDASDTSRNGPRTRLSFDLEAAFPSARVTATSPATNANLCRGKRRNGSDGTRTRDLRRDRPFRASQRETTIGVQSLYSCSSRLFSGRVRAVERSRFPAFAARLLPERPREAGFPPCSLEVARNIVPPACSAAGSSCCVCIFQCVSFVVTCAQRWLMARGRGFRGQFWPVCVERAPSSSSDSSINVSE
jgi:hypothetical protein